MNEITATAARAAAEDNRIDRTKQGANAAFVVDFEDRKYTVTDGGDAPYVKKGGYTVPNEGVYTPIDGLSVIAAKRSIRSLRSGFTRLHPVRVFLALLFSPILTVTDTMIRLLTHAYVCVPCAALSIFIYHSMGAYSVSFARMDKNSISVPVTLLLMPVIARLIRKAWDRFIASASFPVLINDAERDKVLRTQEQWLELLNKRIKLGEKNNGSFVAIPDIDHYEAMTYEKDEWLTLYGNNGFRSHDTAIEKSNALSNLSTPPALIDSCVLRFNDQNGEVAFPRYNSSGMTHMAGEYYARISDKLITGARRLYAAEKPKFNVADLSYLTDESVNLYAGAMNYSESCAASFRNTAWRRFEPYRKEIAEASAAYNVLPAGSRLMEKKGNFTAQDKDSLAKVPGISSIAGYVSGAIMDGTADEKLSSLRNAYTVPGHNQPQTPWEYAESLYRRDNRSESANLYGKICKEGVSEIRSLAEQEFIADYEKFADIIEKRIKEGVPTGKAGTGKRITESAEVVNFIGRIEKALGHRGLLQELTEKEAWSPSDRYFIGKEGSHVWNGKYHTITDVQMKATAAGMKKLRKTRFTVSELAMDDNAFVSYITEKFRKEFSDAFEISPKAVKSVYRKYSKLYHPDSAPAEVAERAKTAFTILGEEYKRVRR